MELLSKIGWDEWSALANLILAGTSILLVVLGWVQINRIRDEARKERTLAICNRYDSDPVLNDQLRKVNVAAKGGGLLGNAPTLIIEIVAILNYLDSIAIGIAQKVYDDKIAKRHLKAILVAHVEQLMTPEMAKAAKFKIPDFECLVDLTRRWTAPDDSLHWWLLYSA
jgi:hypothetical protein